jgi:hypothetical protein
VVKIIIIIIIIVYLSVSFLITHTSLGWRAATEMLRAPPYLAKAWRLCGRNGEEPVDGEKERAVGVRGLKGVVCGWENTTTGEIGCGVDNVVVLGDYKG